MKPYEIDRCFNYKPGSKTILAVLVLSILAFSSPVLEASNRYSRSNIGSGLSFGYHHTSYRTVDWGTDEVVDKNGLNGFYVGFNHDISLISRTRSLFAEVGLNYIYQNKSQRNDIASLKLLGDKTEHAVSIPVRLKYVFPVNYDVKVFVAGGPTLYCGISSKLLYRTKTSESEVGAIEYNYYRGNTHVRNMPEEVAVWFASQLPDFHHRKMDVLLGGAVGAEFFNILELHVGYDWGMVNRNKGDEAYFLKTHRHQFYVSAGLRF